MKTDAQPFPVPEQVFAAFDGVLRSEIGTVQVAPSASALDRLAHVTFGVAADKAVRDHWLHAFPLGSIEWPDRYVVYVHNEVNSSRVRLSFHELALRALIAKVKSRCYRLYQANRDRPEGYSEFTCFRPGFGAKPACAAIENSCHRTLRFDWNGYLNCDQIDCRCDATLLGERSVRRIIASGFKDRTESIEPVHL